VAADKLSISRIVRETIGRVVQALLVLVPRVSFYLFSGGRRCAEVVRWNRTRVGCGGAVHHWTRTAVS